MATTREPLLGDLKDEAGELWDELRGLADARWELARLEAVRATQQVQQLAIIGGVCLVVLLVSLPLLVVAAAGGLAGTLGLSREAWLALIGGMLLVGSLTVAALAWLGFRRRFEGFARSLAELREDVVWLKEKDWFPEAEQDETEGDEGEEYEDEQYEDEAEDEPESDASDRDDDFHNDSPADNAP